MDAGTLERLLIDRVLGGLSPDTEALLAAYLAERPAERAAGERIEQTVAAAKAALADRAAVRVPPFPNDAIRRRGSVRERWSMREKWMWAGRAASLAACIFIGMVLQRVWTAGAARNIEPPGRVTLVEAPRSVQVRTVAAEAESPSFWSAKQWYERTGERRPVSGRRVIWDSPLSTPRLGDAT